MASTLDEMMAGLAPERRAKIEQAAASIVVENRMLRDLRKSMKVTQGQLAAVLGTSQANVAQIEGSDDVKVSTVARIVEALGGTLQMTVQMPGRPVATFTVGSGAAAGNGSASTRQAQQGKRTKAPAASLVDSTAQRRQRA